MAHNYAAVRYPWVTSVSFVSEVSDETAQGDYLALCALAHYNHDIAILKMLSETAVITDRTNQTENMGDNWCGSANDLLSVNTQEKNRDNQEEVALNNCVSCSKDLDLFLRRNE